MKRILLALALIGAAGLATGCSQTVRSVTHVATFDGDNNPYIYIAYAENDDVSKLRRCLIQADNSLQCNEEGEVNRLLNAEDDK